MVSGDLVALPTVERGALYDVHARTVVALHVKVGRDEVTRAAVVQIARDGEGLEKNLGHDHGAAQVQHDAAVVNVGERRREAAKIAVTRVADRGAVRRRVLVNDLGAQRRVDGRGNSQLHGGE